jgi:acetyl-CoA carboxylase biotin carboxyl carrier protein
MSKDIILTPDDVAQIVAILDGTSYERIDISTGRFTLRVARSGEGWTQDWNWEGGEKAPAVVVASGAALVAAPIDDATDGSMAVRPPLPGVFFRAPQPGADPFVQEGDSVTPDTVIGIIETMKLMNPVHAGLSGTVSVILVDNAVQIDTDTIILRVMPDGQ